MGDGAGVSRLIYGYANGVARGPRRTRFDNTAARLVDRSLGALGAAGPCLLVSGFWRSGTTWLQETLATALGAKTVFEPLSPMEPARRAALAAQNPDDSEDLMQATIPGPLAVDADDWRYLDRTCRGSLATEYLMSCRRDVAESFRRDIVVKDVRLQANLAAFHRRHDVPVVHVRRHPCAVVASLAAANWHWSFANVTLAALLPRLGPVLAAGERDDLVERFDTDPGARIATFWAVTERLAAAELADQPWGALVSYEAFALAPYKVLDQLCGRLRLRQTSPVDASTPSASVSPEAFAAYRTPPQERWRSQLSGTDAARIRAIADAVYPDWQAADIDHATPNG